jgi:predicted signal transduction protein with EAL and GGDEF domain
LNRRSPQILKISKPYSIRQHKITYLTPSIGIVLIPFGETDREGLVKKADTAMYEAKRQGKNRYQFFKESMTKIDHAPEHRKQFTDPGKNKSFDRNVIFYTNLLSPGRADQYQIIGVELYWRWYNAELGLVMPICLSPLPKKLI